ncbi:MAG: methylmalonyl-CoA mutase, partial [Nonomuraea sp.]|nr:methylmalonyl-CoA mutase [Nonomuraea sp.]
MELAAEFPPATRDGWRAMALEVLRKSGAPESALSRATYDGLTVEALYDRASLPADLARLPRGRTGWDVRQRHAIADPQAVLADLENGVTSLWLAVGPDAIPVSALAGVLADVYLDLAPVVLDAGPLVEEAAQVLFGLAVERGVPLHGNLGAGEGAAGLALRCVAEHPGLRAIVVDG